MQDPQELGGLLAESGPTPTGPSRAAPPLPDNEVPIRQIGQWALVWRRFRRHRLALIGARTLLLMLALAIVGPMIAPDLIPNFTRVSQNPHLWPLDWNVLGTTGTGLPILGLLLAGARATLAISILGAALATLLGSFLGVVSGYFGRVVDAMLMRVVDAFLTVPFLPLLVMLSLYLPDRGIAMFGLVFGLTGWAGVARLVRSSCLSIRQRDYTEAARALGVSDLGVVGRHILPNALDVVIVSGTLNVALFLVAEASLAFLGAGPADVTWGGVLAGSYAAVISGFWWPVVFPGTALLLAVLAVNFLGDGLRDALENAAPSQVVDIGAEEPGPLSRALSLITRRAIYRVQWVGGSLAAGRAHLAAHAPAWRLPARRVTARPATPKDLSWTLRFLPPAAALLLAGLAVLWGHSPLRYSPHYGAPATIASAYGPSEYGAWPAPNGRWDLFEVDATGHVAYLRVAPSGSVEVRQVVTRSDASAVPSMAESGGKALGAWVADEGQAVDTAYLGARHPAPFPVSPRGGIVDHPDVVALPGGGFDVLFQWQVNRSTRGFDIYLASIPPGATRPRTVRRIERSTEVGCFPRGAIDGSGALDVLWMNRFLPGFWHVESQRFTLDGRPLGRLQTLEEVHYFKPLPGGGKNLDVVPPQWGLDLKTAGDGSVWGAWEGDAAVSVAHWSRTGRSLLPRRVAMEGIDGGFGATRAVALVPGGRGGVLYHTFPGDVSTYVEALPFDAAGRPIGEPERVNYNGGRDYNPHAGSLGGAPRVVWQRGHLGAADVEATSYHPAQPPDLLTHLGLNIGNGWANAALILLGSLGAGVVFGAVNILIVLALILAWLLAGRLGRFFSPTAAWWVYLGIIALVLVLLFAVPAAPPAYVLVISGLGFPDGWVAAACGVLVSFWAGWFIFGRVEPFFRASLMALSAVYVVAVLYAAVLIQGEIGRI